VTNMVNKPKTIDDYMSEHIRAEIRQLELKQIQSEFRDEAIQLIKTYGSFKIKESIHGNEELEYIIDCMLSIN